MSLTYCSDIANHPIPDPIEQFPRVLHLGSGLSNTQYKVINTRRELLQAHFRGVEEDA